MIQASIALPRCEELSGVHVRQVLNFVTMQRKQQKAGWYESKLEEAKSNWVATSTNLKDLVYEGLFCE